MRIRAIGFFLFATIAASMPARAQVTVDIAKITCKQALLDTVAPTKSIALWLSGYYNGKRGNTLIDAGALQKNADKVEDYCRMNLDTTLMDAVQAVFGVSK